MLNRLFSRLLFALAVAAACVLAFLIVSVNFEVFMRYALGAPTSWVADLSTYSLLFILFLGAPWVLQKESHISIDILLYFCPPAVQRTLNFVASVIGAVTCAVFSYFCVVVVWKAYSASELLWHGLVLHKWTVWIVMPIGTLLLTVQFVRRAWNVLRNKEVEPDFLKH